MRFILTICFFFIYLISFGQDSDTLKQITWQTQLPTIVANHPLGIFLTQAQVNFSTKANQSAIQFDYSAGNIWLPQVTAFYPTNTADRLESGQYPWHYRDPKGMTSPDTLNFSADGVLRSYKVGYQWIIGKSHSLQITANVYSLDGGKFPFSTLTNDKVIEWFHSKIAGGEDPFARKEYEFNEALIEYQDKNGEKIQIKKGDVGLSGFVFNYNYNAFSKSLSKLNAELTTKVVAGINSSRFNSSLDLGLGITGAKNFEIDRKNILRAGLNYEVIKHNLIVPNERVILTDQNYMTQFGLFLGWEHIFQNNRAFSVSTLYQHQSSYRNPEPTNYYALEGAKEVSHWHYTVSHLYQNNDRVSLILAFQNNKITYSFYLNEDIVLINNAPDIQTGFSFRYLLGVNR